MQVIVNNLQITYTDSGSDKSRVIVFIHGWNDSAKTFAPLIELLSRNYRCVALDLPNFGNSQQTEDIITVADYADLVKAFAKKLKIEDYFLVGHSMGGQIAIYGVGNNVLKPKKLVLIAAAGLRNKQLAAKTTLRYITKPFKKLVSKDLKNKMYQKIGSDYQANLSPIHKKIISSVLRDDVQADARMVHIPTILIYGEADRHTSVAIGRRFNELIVDSSLMIIRDQDHWLHQKAALDVAAKIAGFTK